MNITPFSSRRARALSILLLAAGVGCGEKTVERKVEASPAALPERLVFKGNGSSQTTKSSGSADEWGSCYASAEREGLKVSCDSKYEFTLEVGTQRSADKFHGVTVDVVPALGSARIEPVPAEKNIGKVVFDDIDPATTVKLTFADGKSIQGPLVPFDSPWPPDGLRKAIEQPLQFGASEPPHAGAHSILFYRDAEDSAAFVFGPARTLHEVDWVAVRSKPEHRDGGRKCDGYTVLGGGGPAESFPLEVEALTLSIRDRRSGAEITSKTFVARKECPSSITNGKALSTVYWIAQQEWALSELKKRR